MKMMLIFLALLVALLPLGAVYHKIGDYATPLDAQAVVVENGITYLAEGLYDGTYSILQTLDFSNPLNPFPLGSITLPLDLYDSQRGIDLEVKDGVAYVAHKDAVHALKIVDVSDPLNPALLNSIPVWAHDVCLVDSLAYVASRLWGLLIYDVSDPLYEITVGGLNTSGWAECVAVAGNIAIVGNINPQGLKLIDVSNPYNPVLLGSINGFYPYSIAVSGTLAIIAGNGVYFIDTFYPEFPIILSVSVSETTASANSVTLSGDVAYVASNMGMSAVDFSDPQNPAQIGVYALSGNTMDVQVVGNTAYLAGSEGLQCVDISQPQNPALVASQDTQYTQSFDFADDLVYVADGFFGLQIIDVSAAQNPVLLGTFDTDASADHVAVSNDIAYVTGKRDTWLWDRISEFNLIDVSNPQDPEIMGSFSSSINEIFGFVAVQAGTAYVACGSSLKVINVSDPQNLTLITEYTVPGEIKSISISASVAYVATGAGLQILDISDPQVPVLLGSYTTTTDYASISGNIACLALGSSGAQILDVSNPAAPVLVSSLPPHHATSYIDRCLIRDNRLFISDNNWNEISSYDISAPQTPVLIDRYAWNLSTSDMWVNGNLLYTANGAYGLNIHDLNLVSVDDPVQVPPSVFQMRNYPNPFNPETMISYILPASGKVSLEIFNSRGQLVRSMLHQEQLAGEHSLIWNGKDDSGHSVASGLYLCRIACNGTHETRKMLLLK